MTSWLAGLDAGLLQLRAGFVPLRGVEHGEHPATGSANLTPAVGRMEQDIARLEEVVAKWAATARPLVSAALAGGKPALAVL